MLNGFSLRTQKATSPAILATFGFGNPNAAILSSITILISFRIEPSTTNLTW